MRSRWQNLLTSCLAAAFLAARSAGQDGAQEHRGRLEEGDQLYAGDEYYYDEYEFAGAADEVVALDVVSQNLDVWLAVKCADDPEFAASGDDWGPDASRAHLLLTLPLSGQYVVHVSSNDKLAEGDYDLRIVRGAAALETVPSGSGRIERRSRLQTSDGKLPTGEHYELYQIAGLPGQQVVARVESEDFDPYVYLRCPCDGAMTVGNEDFEESDEIAQIEATVTVASTLNVYVTSDEQGETGAYELSLSVWNAAEREAGRLTQLDDKAGEVSYDQFVYRWRQGQEVAISLSSQGFTPHLRVVPPEQAGGDIVFDRGPTGRARLEFAAPADGDYSVLVMSVEDEGTGAYEVELRTHADTP